MYLNSINFFRGIAIIFIVMGHCPAFFNIDGIWYFLNLDGLLFLDKIIYTLITGGTSLFVFISGFLFHHIFYRRYEFKKFIKKKYISLLPPYILLSFCPYVILIYLENPKGGEYFLPQGEGIWFQYLKPYLLYLWTGRVDWGYWYIPFILVTFALSPLHMLFIKQKIYIQLITFASFLAISMLIYRPASYSINNFYVFHHVLYYTPLYLMGMFCSMHKERIYKLFYGKEYMLVLCVLLLSVLQVEIFGHVGQYWRDSISFGELDIIIVQKIFMCLFFMVFLHRFEEKECRVLSFVADRSFAIFFLHVYLITFLHWLNYQYSVEYNIFSLATVTVFVLFGSSIIASIIKHLLKNNSKYLIGW